MAAFEAVQEFNGDEFMDRYESFTTMVNGKKIAKRLFIEKVIPESLLHYIEKEAPRAGNEKLRMHLARHSTQSDIRKLCNIMITTRGHPKMRILGLKMLEDKELPAMTDFNATQFMEKYKEFLHVVDVKKIAAHLHVESVIDSDLLYYMNTNGPKASVEELFIHLQYCADIEAIKKVCLILVKTKCSRMRKLGQKMLSDEDLPGVEFLIQNQSHRTRSFGMKVCLISAIAATLIAAAIIMTAIWQPPYPCSWPIQDIIEPYFTFCEKPEDTKPSNKQEECQLIGKNLSLLYNFTWTIPKPATPSATLQAFTKYVPFMPVKLVELDKQELLLNKRHIAGAVLMDDILDFASGRQGKHVLIVGDHGTGKSRLLEELSYRFVNGQFGQDYKAVIGVQLQYLRENAKIEDIFFTILNRRDKKSIVKQFLKCFGNGEGVLFLLDTFEEINFDADDSSVNILVDIFNGRLMSKATFIITSRFSAVVDSKVVKHVDRCIEILGFEDGSDQSSIHSFTKSYFNISYGNVLFNQLQKNPYLYELCHKPLYLRIVCFIIEDERELPRDLIEGNMTISKLVDHFVCQLMAHDGASSTCQCKNRTILDLTGKCTELTKMAQLSLDRVRSSELQPDQFHPLGLMYPVLNQTSDKIIIYNQVDHYQPIHPVLNDFLAAYSVVILSSSEQLDFWEYPFFQDNDEEVVYHLLTGVYETMFLFYSGLSKLKSRNIQQLLLNSVKPSIGLHISFANPLIQVCTFLHESQNVVLVKDVLNYLGNELEAEKCIYKNPHHYLTTAWCLSHHSNLTGLKFSSWSAAEVSHFLNVFGTECTSHVQSLDWHISWNSFNSTDFNAVFNFGLVHRLESLELNVMDLTETQAQQGVANLLTASLSSLNSVKITGSQRILCLDSLAPLLRLCGALTSISLRSVTVTHHHLRNLLLGLPTLSNLAFYRVKVKSYIPIDDAIREISMAVRKLEKLTDVSIQGYFSKIFEQATILALKDLVHLKRLEIGIPIIKGFCREEVLAPVVQSLQNGAITELRISGLQLSNDASYELFFSNLRHSPISVLSLKFGVTEELFSGTGKIFTTFKTGLQSCLHLMSLTVGGVLPSKGWILPVGVTQHVVAAVSSCSRLNHLEITRCTFDHELIKRLAVFIGNSSLKSVKLTDVDGFSARSIVTFLMKSLKSNLLEELLIYSSEMSDDQDVFNDDHLEELQQVVKENASLKHLTIQCAYLKWSNVAEAIVEGAGENNNSYLENVDLIVDRMPGNLKRVKHKFGKLTVTMKVTTHGKF